MRIKYNRDQKIKGNLTRNFDKDYAFLEKALDRSGDIVKNVFYVTPLIYKVLWKSKQMRIQTVT